MGRRAVVAVVLLLVCLVSAVVVDAKNGHDNGSIQESRRLPTGSKLSAAFGTVSSHDIAIDLEDSTPRLLPSTEADSADPKDISPLRDLPHERRLGVASFSESRESSLVDTFEVTAGMTNESFTDDICSLLASNSGGLLYITGTSCLNLTLPSCVSTSSLLGIRLTTCIVVDSFAAFPSSLISLELENTIFAPKGSVTLAFDADGMVQWGDIFDHMPNLVSLYIDSTNLRGSLPASIPSQLSGFLSLDNNELSGAIPATLFNNLPMSGSNIFSFSGNKLSGSIPETLFVPFTDLPPATVVIQFSNNELSGSLPATLLQPFASANFTTFQLDLGGNKLNGSLPEKFFPPQMMTSNNATATTAHLDLSSNQLTGSLPASFFQDMPPVSSLTLALNNNRLNGTLPSPLLPNGWLIPQSNYIGLYLNLSTNAFTGSIPSDLLGVSSLTQNLTLQDLALYLDNNEFDTLPDQLFSAHTTTKRDTSGRTRGSAGLDSTFETTSSISRSSSSSDATDLRTLSVSGNLAISLQHNSLNGTFPGSMLAYATTSGGSVNLVLENNRLTGPFPEEAFGAFSALYVVVMAANNSFTTLPGCAPGVSYYDFSQNALSSTIPHYTGCTPVALLVNDNPGLTGSLPPGYPVNLVILDAHNTGLTGNLTTWATSASNTMDLSGTKIDFCSNASISAFSAYAVATCNLNNTSACQCYESYAQCATTACNPTTIPSVPTNPPSSPPSTPAPPCPPTTRPSPEFICINGHWSALIATAPTLTIPSGAGSITVTGNVTSSSIVINGLGSTLSIGGCAANLTQVVIELDAETIKELTSKTLQTLVNISSSATSCTNLNTASLSTRLRSSTCKSVTTEKVISGDGTTLSALFTVNSSGCNTWWIILVSVVGGVVVLVVIAIVLMAIFWPRFREKIRPYSKASENRRSAVA